MAGWVGRRYLTRIQKKGLSAATNPFLPRSAMLPLARDGLDPVRELGRRRAQAPISRLALPFGITAWLVTGYEEARTVLGMTERLSNDFAHLVGLAGTTAAQNPGGLGFTDPPAHTRLRRLLTPEFTLRRLDRLTPRIDAIVAEQLDQLAGADTPDLVRDFAQPIPALVICELLGIPFADRVTFQELSTARFDLLAGATASLGAISESLSYLLGVVAAQRDDPGDGLLGALVREHGEHIDDRELAALADGLLTGGVETTASMLALGALVLLEDPERATRIRDDDDAVGPFVEELLRYLSVVQVAFPRFAREDMDIAGIHIAKGDGLLCSLSGANRDPRLGEDMERFDPTRPHHPHLAFGHGIHRCIGAELARMELRAAYPALVRRFPTMRLAEEPEHVSFRRFSMVYGVDSLPVLLA